MGLTRLSLQAPAGEVEALSDFLESWGAESVALLAASGEPVFDEAALWAATRIEALYQGRERAEAAARALAGAFRPATACEITEVEERDWAVVWREGLTARLFGGRLWVHPSWSVPEGGEALRIMLDPGMAFGTGQHPTTALCLEWLARADGLADREVLDYGCGSGVLALAALRLGAGHAIAVDCDEQALAVTRENAVKNELADRIVTAAPDALKVAGVEFIVANILLKPLLDLAPRFAELSGSGGRLVLSGILAEQLPPCVAAYEAFFVLEPPIIAEGWALLWGTRR
jgi:ribosomal protein L11 methyltransferase